jgi:ketopantoate reductase
MSDVAIVGGGAIGGILAYAASVAGHEVTVCVRNGVDHTGDPGAVPALAYISAKRVAPGRVVHRAGDLLVLPAGAVGSGFAPLLDGSPVRVSLSDDFLTDAWRKLLTNVAANPVTALTLRPIGVAERARHALTGPRSARGSRPCRDGGWCPAVGSGGGGHAGVLRAFRAR